MTPQSRIRAFAGRHPLTGPLLWLLSAQYFLVQIVVASAWSPPYNWRLNAISDLGATRCGQFDGRFMCSPRHAVMNASLIVLGLLMAAGSALVHQQEGRGRAGFALMAAAGAGVIVVGVVPLDTIYWLHIAGADVALLVGNVALLVLGCTLRLPRLLTWFSIASGSMGLAALGLFLSHHRYSLELGGMERVAAYPQTIWLTVLGLYMTRRRLPSLKSRT